MKELLKKSVNTINYWIVILQLFYCLVFLLWNKQKIATMIWYLVCFFGLIWFVLDLMNVIKIWKTKCDKLQKLYEAVRLIVRIITIIAFFVLGANLIYSKTIWFMIIFFVLFMSVIFSRRYDTWKYFFKKYFFKRKKNMDNLNYIIKVFIYIVLFSSLFVLAILTDNYLNDEFLIDYHLEIDGIISDLIANDKPIIFIIYYSLLLHIDSLFDFTLQIAILYISCFIAIVSIFKTKIHGIEIGDLYRWFCTRTLYFANRVLPFLMIGIAYIAYVSNYLLILLLVLFYYVNIAAMYIYFVFRIHDDKYFISVVTRRIQKEEEYLKYYSMDYKLFNGKQKNPEISEFCERFLDFPVSIIAKVSTEDKLLLEYILKIVLNYIKKNRRQKTKYILESGKIDFDDLFAIGYIYYDLLESIDINDEKTRSKRSMIFVEIINSIQNEIIKDLIGHITLVYFAIHLNNDKKCLEEPFIVYNSMKKKNQFWLCCLIVLNAIARSDAVDIPNILNSVYFLSEHRSTQKMVKFNEYREMCNYYLKFWKLIYQRKGIQLDVRENCDSCASYYFNLEVIRCGKRHSMFFVHDEVR